MDSQPPKSEEIALRRPLFACLLVIVGWVVYQGRNPFVQITGLSLAFWGGFALVQIAWESLRQRRNQRERALAVMEQEAKQEARRERRSLRKEATREEREREAFRKEREARERKERHEQAQAAQKEVARREQERASRLDAETRRLLALADTERQDEFRRLLQKQGYSIEREEPLEIGRRIALKSEATRVCAIWIEDVDNRLEKSVEPLLKCIAESEYPVRWLISFEGFPREALLALKGSPVQFADPYQLAQWAVS